MSDFLDTKRREISDRLKELAPLVDEYHRLEAASSALDSVKGNRAPSTRPTLSRPAGAGRRGRRPAGGGGPGRPRGSGGRSAQALALVQGQPGITVSELAARMDIKQNYLYRVLPGLEQDGKVEKQGRGWHPRSGGQEQEQ